MQHLQSEQFLERVELAVMMEQGTVVLEAERGDQAVSLLKSRNELGVAGEPAQRLQRNTS